MKPIRNPAILSIAGLMMVIGSILTVKIIDRPLDLPDTVRFTDTTGDQLTGTYHGGDIPAGAMLLEGFGSDQVTMRSAASRLAREGYHVFTFDFSGHGKSPGTLAFDNARTDRLAYQALAALEKFEQLSGLRDEQITLVGHSLGARVALQMAVMSEKPLAGLLLLGTQVNLSQNIQTEFFTGTSDAELRWVQSLGLETPAVPIELISGEWDDVLSPENARQLFEELTDEKPDTNRTLTILPAVVHNFEVFSSRNGLPNGWTATGRTLAWIAGFAGFLLCFQGGTAWVKESQMVEVSNETLIITNPSRFLWGKLLLWLAALPFAAILGGSFFFLPIGKPVINLIYVGFIGGYGILFLSMYWRGKVPGVRGKLPFAEDNLRKDRLTLVAVLGITVATLVLTAAYARTGWFYVFPTNARLFWLAAFTPFTALGFWIGLQEGRLLPAKKWMHATHALIGLVPFFLYSILMACIGSLSGMINGLQGLLILWLVIAFGQLIQSLGNRSWLSAFCMAVLLYWLVLPQGVLFQ